MLFQSVSMLYNKQDGSYIIIILSDWSMWWCIDNRFFFPTGCQGCPFQIGQWVVVPMFCIHFVGDIVWVVYGVMVWDVIIISFEVIASLFNFIILVYFLIDKMYPDQK